MDAVTIIGCIEMQNKYVVPNSRRKRNAHHVCCVYNAGKKAAQKQKKNLIENDGMENYD